MIVSQIERVAVVALYLSIYVEVSVRVRVGPQHHTHERNFSFSPNRPFHTHFRGALLPSRKFTVKKVFETPISRTKNYCALFYTYARRRSEKPLHEKNSK